MLFCFCLFFAVSVHIILEQEISLQLQKLFWNNTTFFSYLKRFHKTRDGCFLRRVNFFYSSCDIFTDFAELSCINVNVKSFKSIELKD